MTTLKVIVGSTRPGRVGISVGRWAFRTALEHSAFDTIELLDLAEINLPFLDEPENPKRQRYAHEHTKRWSASIETADAFVMVTPEYNHCFPGVLKNALDFLYAEWAHKPVGIVSYGGPKGGVRAAELLRHVLPAYRLVPVYDAVHIPFVHRLVDENGEFAGAPDLVLGFAAMLEELARVEAAVRQLRN